MEPTQLKRLNTQLSESQRSKKQGLVSASLLEAFVDFGETTESLIRRSESSIRKFNATLTPKTHETEYWESHEWPPRSTVGYCGPYTTVYYDDGTYRIERVGGRTEYYMTSRAYKEGITAKIELDGRLTVGQLLRVGGSKRTLVSGHSDGGISLTFRVPLERIRMTSKKKRP